jgi:hypothetical protein
MAFMRRHTKWIIAELIPILALIAACASPPQSAERAGPPDRTLSITMAAALKVKNIWHPGMLQLGINVYWVANQQDSAAVISAKARRIINYAISLNANSITLSFPFYTYGITSNKLYASISTPPPAHVALFLAQAAKSDVRVTLRPILNEDVLVAQNPIAWRGSIEPTSRAAWFQSYQRLLKPYAAAAQGHAATFVIGTELVSLEGDSHWPKLIRSIRSVFRGQLSYDENYVQYERDDTGLPLPGFDVDAYPRFKLPDSATVGRVTKAWELWLDAHSLAVRKKTILSEVGIIAVAGAYSDPGEWLGVQQLPAMPSVQANWYDAACKAVQKEHIGGLYWWDVNFDADPADPAPFQSDKITFLGRPAQQQVESCFARLAGSHV